MCLLMKEPVTSSFAKGIEPGSDQILDPKKKKRKKSGSSLYFSGNIKDKEGLMQNPTVSMKSANPNYGSLLRSNDTDVSLDEL